MINSLISGWVFKIPHEYENCELTEEECEAILATKVHEFNRFVDAINSIEVTCSETPDANELPDWTWKVAGKMTTTGGYYI